MFRESFAMRGWYLLGALVGLGSMFAPIITRSSAAGGGQALQQQAEQKQVCSLSDRQQQAAPRAFGAMMPTFQDPRCINCHGVVNPVTGAKHGGGPRRVDECDDCHELKGWRTPDPAQFFVRKDSVEICKQMKKQLPDASAFLAHITEDRGMTPFIQVAFKGTRSLNDLGQQTYEDYAYEVFKVHKKYKPEPPKSGTHDDFITAGEGWVIAMGGKFTGDEECGCVPHHYSLSIDMKTIQDSHLSASVTHIELSGHTDIPLEFKDDGSFIGEAPLPMTQTGYTQAVNIQCTMKGSLTMTFLAKGRAEDSKPILHLVVSNRVTGGSVTTTCNNGISGNSPYESSSSAEELVWDMPSFVGMDQDYPLPLQHLPDFTSSLKIRINQTD